MTGQKEAFLASEGDQWFRRNSTVLASRDFSRDAICRKLESLSGSALRVLEVGCSDGSRLRYIADRHGHDVSGIDPSAEAVERARAGGVNALQATADRLPFGDSSFDVVIFGFCLYLCDDKDLFRIALEADRVLAETGWLLIFDFEASAPSYRPYHHLAGLRSRKMDNKTMFLWHPAYTLASHEKFHHATGEWTDDPNEWVSLACLRKQRTP